MSEEEAQHIIQCLVKERDELLADARRYRWLRERRKGWTVTGTTSHDFGEERPGKLISGVCVFTDDLHGTGLDAAVDQAMQEKGHE